MTFKIRIEPVSDGTTGENNPIQSNAAQTAIADMHRDSPSVTIVRLSTAQIAGISKYIASIKLGLDTSSIETALTSLLF